MTTIFEGSPKFGGISGDHARVMALNGLVLIRVVDVEFADAVVISITPAQARALAQGIIAAAEKAEAHQ